MNAPFVKDNFYHIYNRGVNGMRIFYTSANYIYLLRKIKATVVKYGVDMIAYCLMPNHYHFLVRQLSDRSLSQWVQMLFNGYSQAINQQLNRKGTLFQNRAKHILIDKDEYLVHLIRYIHYNPVEAGFVHSPEEWQFSNYLEWIGLRKGTLFNSEVMKAYFLAEKDYQDFVMNYHIEKQLVDELKSYYLE